MRNFKLGWLVRIGLLAFLVVPLAMAEDANQAENRFIADKMRLDKLASRINCATKLRCSLTLTSQFYLAESSAALWTHNGAILSSALDMLAIIRNAYLDGLNPDDYHLSELRDLKAKIEAKPISAADSDSELLADFDVTLTDAFLLYAKHMLYGRVDNTQVYPNWLISKRSESLTVILSMALAHNSVNRSLNELTPRYSGYELLKAKLNRYQKVAADGGWESISAGPVLKLGSHGLAVKLLQKRLNFDNESDTLLHFSPGVFDNHTRQALLEFQQKNQLKASGIVDAKTRSALNIPLQQRLKIIALNMDRLRWLPLDMGWRYILVNIPDFSLVVVKNKQVIMRMPVIVGKGTNRSCILNSKMSYLELNPFWTIPNSIAKKELLPKLQQDPNHLAKDQIRVYTSFDSDGREVNPLKINWKEIEPATLNYKFRQDSGPKNALGRVKFIFPNDCGIYLHDTPSRNLFNQNRRDFSHGCIRIGKPLELADYLLADKVSWTPAKIESQIATGKRQLVFLNDPIDVHIIYATAWVDANGALQFRNDIYNIDNIAYSVYLPIVGKTK